MELRRFEGSAEELHRFVVGVWKASYAGKMPFPCWTPDYFDWHFGLTAGESRDHLICAYDGTRLIGTLLGIPLQFHVHGEEFHGTQGSWLSVDPDYRRMKVGSQLRERCLQVHREHALKGQFGYVYQGSALSQGNPFWKPQQKASAHQLRQVGFWVRILDARRAAGWNINRTEGWATWLGAPLVFEPRAATPAVVRPFQPEDLPRCLTLANDAGRRMDCGVLWTEGTLALYLSGNGVGQCRVALHQDEVRAFCSFHLLPFLGVTEEPVGIVDFALAEQGHADLLLPLLNDVLAEMKRRGAILSLMMRAGNLDLLTALRAGFVPRMADSSLCFVPTGTIQNWPQIQDFNLLWR